MILSLKWVRTILGRSQRSTKEGEGNVAEHIVNGRGNVGSTCKNLACENVLEMRTCELLDLVICRVKIWKESMEDKV